MNMEWIISLSAYFFGGILFARIFHFVFKYVFFKISSSLQESFQKQVRLLSATPYSVLVLIGCWHIGFNITLDPKDLVYIQPVILTLLCYSSISILYQLVDLAEVYINNVLNRHDQKASTINKNLLPYSKKILKIAIALLIVLFVLQNVGFNVTSLLAGVGVGGVAIALAAKETLGHLFGGVSIIVDKPFATGDWISCQGIEGTVVDIGFRSTKIKTFYDSVVTLPNATISDSVIDNLGRRQARRTRVTLGVTYDTSPEKIEAFVKGIKEILNSNEFIKKDYYQVYFSHYGDSSLNILLNFFLKVSDWDSELAEKQKIFLDILRLSKKLGVSFAFPTQTLDIPNWSKKTFFETKE